MQRTALALAIALALPANALAAPAYVMSWSHPGMCSPRGVGIGPDGDVYVFSDCVSPQVMRFTSNGTFVTSWAIGQPGNGLAVDALGNVFVGEEQGTNVIRKFTGSGVLLTAWGSTGTGPGQFQWPVGVEVDAAGSVYVVDLVNDNVQKFTNNGGFLLQFGTPGAGVGQFLDATGAAVDGLGRIYVTDGTRGMVLRFSPGGVFQLEFPAVGPLPADVAIGPDGNLYVPDGTDYAIRVFTQDGAHIDTFGGGLLSLPWRIAIDHTGALYVTEQYNHRVSKFQITLPTAARTMTLGKLKALYR